MRTQILAGLLLGLVGVAQASSDDLQRCRSVTEATARLSCYDAIPLPSSQPRSTPEAPLSRAVADTAGKKALPTAVEPRDASSSPSASFGLPAPKSSPEADRVESRILGLVEEFPRGFQYRLENGQVWQITETAMGFYQLRNPKVRISKGLLGSFHMQIEGVAAVPKVRRIQ